jgi:outer membrane protein assembly factor BamE (lipoprotein component of BamABCDE complex)
MRRTAALLATGLVAVLVVAGCQLTRQHYQAVAIGQTPEQVQKALGAPRFQFGGQWVWTNDDPRDITKVAVWFGPDKKVVGKSWQNPEKPWENDREGRAPQP